MPVILPSSLLSLDVRVGDCRQLMREMPDESVQCCVTSPPYWGLRDYGHPDQIGQEETPDAFVQAMVEVFREVRRVLKADGTCWLNLGDSHVDKSLVGIPWLVAMSLKADGWYLRQDIIWAKPNPMPESVTDRCTKSHEYIFLLTKSDRYYYDNEAIKEKCETSDPSSVSYRKNGKSDSRTKHEKICLACDGSGDETDEYGDDCKKCGGTGLANISGAKTAVKNSGVWIPPPSGRIKRSVWTVPTAPYKGAHFATYPPDLIKPCIMAGTKPGDVVLDPFGGSGTTGQVAIELGRRAILCELNPDYAEIIHQRTNVTMGLAL